MDDWHGQIASVREEDRRWAESVIGEQAIRWPGFVSPVDAWDVLPVVLETSITLLKSCKQQDDRIEESARLVSDIAQELQITRKKLKQAENRRDEIT